MSGQLPYHAKFELGETQKQAEAEVLLNNKEIGLLHGTVDKPGAEFDVVILDRVGNEQARRHFKPANERFGERINLPLTDDYYKVRVENVIGAKKIDVFVE